MKTIHVEVTQEDIAAGKRRDPAACPLAIAISRAAGRRSSVGVTMSTVRCTPDTFVNAYLPESAIEFRRRFDGLDPVAPIAFDIEVDL